MHCRSVREGRRDGGREGLMSVSWKEGYDPAELAQRLHECRQVGGSGEVSFTGFEVMDYFALLYSMLSFPDAVPEIEGEGA